MPPAQIMVIRHGEKPDNPPPHGIDQDGNQNPHSLIINGWQRAGALVNFFCAPQVSGIQRPTHLYSPPAEGTDEGGRPFETIHPLSTRLQLNQHTKFSVGQEPQLVADVMTRDGAIVLIAWEHKHIPIIANTILQSQSESPQHWPGSRFDVVWVFTHTPSGWQFSQVPQLLLAGDQDSVIPMEPAAAATG